MQAAIYGLEGLDLKIGERDFIRNSDPVGFILFKRNCETRDQMLQTHGFPARSDGASGLANFDRSRGRTGRANETARMGRFPAGERFAELFQLAPSSAIEAVRANARAIALMLRDVGVNVNALPLLDVRQEGASDVIGDRALGSQPMQVAALGRAVLDGMASAGVIGIVKHMPGHGRALVDSHQDLPIVTASPEELEKDLEPFAAARLRADGNDGACRLHGVGLGTSLQPVVIRDRTRSSVSESALAGS